MAPSSRDPATVRRILQERADALALPLEAEDRTEMVGTVGLLVGGERYAIDFQHVIGIEPLVSLTPIPGTPGFWAGLANVRGTMQPILDLREYLGVPADPEAVAPATVVLASGAGITVGLLCDEASDVQWIRAPDIAAAPPHGRTARGVMRGVTSDFVAILNLEALLADPALVVDDDGA